MCKKMCDYKDALFKVLIKNFNSLDHIKSISNYYNCSNYLNIYKSILLDRLTYANASYMHNIYKFSLIEMKIKEYNVYAIHYVKYSRDINIDRKSSEEKFIVIFFLNSITRENVDVVMKFPEIYRYFHLKRQGIRLEVVILLGTCNVPGLTKQTLIEKLTKPKKLVSVLDCDTCTYDSNVLISHNIVFTNNKGYPGNREMTYFIN